MRHIVATLVLSLASTTAFAETTIQMESPPPDQGFRLHAAVGYPSVMALGVGLKSRGGTEVLLQAGGTALWAFLVGTAEVSTTHDLVRRSWWSLNGGLAASLLHSHGFVIDCYGPEVCEDWIQDLWLVSPRAGFRILTDPRKRYGARTYLELGAGPQVGLCRGDCPKGAVVVNAAVNIRVVLDFAAKRPAY